MNRLLPALLALAMGALVVAVTMLSAAATEPDSAFSGRGGGAEALVEEAMAQELETLRLLSGPGAFAAAPDHEPGRTLLVVVAPERPFKAQEAAAVREFLDQGGSVLVADNFGHGNSITTALGITFERVRLVEGTGDGLVPFQLGGASLQVQTAAPTALHIDPSTTHRILAASSTNSFLDRDGDGLVGASEPPGPFPLAVEADVGRGRIIALADPTIFMAEGRDGGDNEAFRRALLSDMLPDGGRVIVDESRTPSSDPWLLTTAAVVETATANPWRYVVAGLSAAVLLVGALSALDGWGPHRFNIDRFVRRADLQSPDAFKPTRAEAPQGVTWTRRGHGALSGGLILAVAGVMLGNQQATYAAAFLLLAGALAAWASPGRVDAQRRLGSQRVHEEGTTDIELSLRPRGRRVAEIEVLDRLAPEFEVMGGDNWFQATLRPKKHATFRYQVRGALRGPHAVGPLRTRASDVFHLRTVEATIQPERQILVLPRLDPLTRIPFKSRVPVLTLGPHLVNRAGDGTEFHALRDYQTGDSIRIVNWKASARSKDLVVNQRVHESMATITVFLDARAITGAGKVRVNPLNEGCRAALSIVTGALQARDKVRLFVYGDGVHELCPEAGRSKSHEMSEALAGLEPRGRTTFMEAVEQKLPDIKASSPFVLLTGTEGDDSIMDGLRLLRQRSVLPFVLALEIDTTSDAESDIDERRLHQERKQAIVGIQSTGTPVLPAAPGMPLGTLFQVGLR